MKVRKVQADSAQPTYDTGFGLGIGIDMDSGVEDEAARAPGLSRTAFHAWAMDRRWHRSLEGPLLGRTEPRLFVEARPLRRKSHSGQTQAMSGVPTRITSTDNGRPSRQ